MSTDAASVDRMRASVVEMIEAHRKALGGDGPYVIRVHKDQLTLAEKAVRGLPVTVEAWP